MKLEVKYDPDEHGANALLFARAVVDWFMANTYSQESAMEHRALLGEVAEYLMVFCKNHPIEDYRGADI